MEARTPYWMISEKWGRIILRSLKGQLQDEMGPLAGDVFVIGETWFRYVVTAVTGCFWQIRCGYGFIIPEDPSYSRRWDEGGDRDDNPRVTPEITRDFCLLASMMAANLYYSQIEDLMFAVYVVMQRRVRSDELLKSSRKDVKHCIEFWEHIPPREPWHVILGDAKNKLYKVKWKQWHDMSILELRILSAGW